MPNQTTQQVADQINKLNSQGATEQQIVDYVTSAGYKPDDFNVDLNGSFRPMVVGTGTITQNYTAAEANESQQYYENLAASSSTITPTAVATASVSGTPTTSRASSSTTTTTEITTTTFQQTTGGGTTTVYAMPATNTSASLAYKSQADQAYILAESYRLNPESKFGRSALDTRLADGRITQEQYNKIINSTPEQRITQSQVYSSQYEQARSNEVSAQQSTPPTVVVQSAQNTSEISVDYQKTTSTSSTKLEGEILEANIKVETIQGTTYQVTENADGSSSYTDVVGESITVYDGISEPLQEPPNVPVDEFDGLDQQIADNENALQEPPALSEEETNAYFDQLQAEQIENYAPADIEESVFDPRQEVQESVFDPSAGGTGGYQGITATKLDTNSQATQQDVSNFQQKEDWRVRLSLAPSANYLYKVPKGSAGILEPLQATDGVIFPYTPQIQVNYQANYDPTDLTHSNYKIFQYKNSGVDSVSITCDFTAQDTYEANYLLAVIHFFRTVTKMFYGQDQNPKPGTPPPLCYLTGLGAFQFDAHPLAITSFNYSLPSDVDYIRAGAVTAGAGVNRSASNVVNNNNNISQERAIAAGAPIGGQGSAPIFSTPPGTVDPTYVPTKIQLTIGAVPVVTRNDISNRFSLKDYATGKLLRGSRNNSGGIW